MYSNSLHLRDLGLAVAVTALLVAVPGASGAFAAEEANNNTVGVVVVAHPGVKVAEVSGEDLKSLFLGRTTSWSDGSPARPAMLAGGPELDEFLKRYIKKAPSHFGLHWKKAVYTGTGTPPAEFATEAELIDYVTRTPGAVGFVATGTDVHGARVIVVH
jgi:hypothetical protein